MPAPDQDDTDQKDADSWHALVTRFPGDQLVEFLDTQHVKTTCIDGLKSVGCPEMAAQPAFLLVRTIAKFALNHVSDALLEKLQRQLMGWAWARVLLRALSKTHDNWRDEEAFRAQLIAELGVGNAVAGVEIDHSLPLDLARDLQNHAKLEELGLSIAELEMLIPSKVRDEIALERQAAGQPVLTWPVQRGVSRTAAGRITYNSGLYPFMGRDAEVETLRRFLGDHRSRFSWTLITGDGGMGKTRLAYELTREHMPANWHAGRLDHDAVFDAERFRPTAPTCIVIDYPAQIAPRAATMLRQIQANFAAFDFPVRVLLLERDTHGEWFKTLLPGGGDSAAVEEHYWHPDSKAGQIGWEIPPVMPDAIAEMMAARLREAGLDDLPDAGMLLSAAYQIDPRTITTEHGQVRVPRPLFAAATAEALVVGKRQGHDWQEIVGGLEREKVLDDLIERDRNLVWTKTGRGSDPNTLALHENLLVLATFGLGLNEDQLESATNLAGAYLPDLGNKGIRPIDHDLLHTMSGGARHAIRPLEPDILGEHFVLSRLAALRKAEAMALRTAALAAIW